METALRRERLDKPEYVLEKVREEATVEWVFAERCRNSMSLGRVSLSSTERRECW